MKNESIRKKETQKTLKKIKIRLSKVTNAPKKVVQEKEKKHTKWNKQQKSSEEKEGEETMFYLKTQTP